MTADQKFFYDCQKELPNAAMHNYPLLVKLRDWVDAEKFANVLREAMKIHTALSSVIEDGRQHYVPGLFDGVTVEHMSEDDFMTLKDNLIQPFDLLGGGIKQMQDNRDRTRKILLLRCTSYRMRWLF